MIAGTVIVEGAADGHVIAIIGLRVHRPRGVGGLAVGVSQGRRGGHCSTACNLGAAHAALCRGPPLT